MYLLKRVILWGHKIASTEHIGALKCYQHHVKFEQLHFMYLRSTKNYDECNIIFPRGTYMFVIIIFAATKRYGNDKKVSWYTSECHVKIVMRERTTIFT